MSSLKDFIVRTLLRMNRLQGTLENWHIITYQDKVRWRGQRYGHQILFGQEGNECIAELISRGEPLLVARLGAVELSCLRFYVEKRAGKKEGYSRKIISAMTTNAGFFPANDETLDAFAKFFLDHLPGIDLMGVWFNQYEDVICNSWCPDARLVDFDCLEPFRFDNPWSARLAGRKVLVVHPFAESIRKQYKEKRQLLFADPSVLPDFDLKTIKAVQSIAGARVDFPTWFDAYRYMCDEIARTEFDICLIGAGAYGLPLAAFAKGMGKQAVHMGGVTQILFGIKGRRWERLYADSTAKLFNEHWVRPLDAETPANNESVEKGCYW